MCDDLSSNIAMAYFILELEINGEIYERKNVIHPQAYFSDFAIYYGDVKVLINTTRKLRISRRFHPSFLSGVDAYVLSFIFQILLLMTRIDSLGQRVLMHHWTLIRHIM